uniref:CEP170 C-terminal domain-containing protein n=1 Tax=Xiphophorus couchianus TaxID=32473 RepID=A0A3B5N0C2_9TELE
VPEEALKVRSHFNLLAVSLCSRPTPLYGQPSWWGEEDYGSKVQSSDEPHSALSDSQPKTVFPSYHREPSYFEIPTKDFQHQKTSEAELHEIPTKDTDAPNAPPTPTPPVVQSHASFTIEFDDCMPGKIKIKDHVTKFSTRQRKGQAPPAKTAATATPAEMMSAQSKVADWLVHSDVSMMRRHPPCEDVYSTKSDLAMNIKTLKGHHHEDGTQSDSEDPVLKAKSKSQHSPPSPTEMSRQGLSEHLTHQGHSGPQRSSSLKREKTEGEAGSSSSSSRSSSGIIVRPFGSVGKKSKLAQEFATEFLKDSASKSFKPAIGPAQVAPLGHPSGPHMSPMLSLGVHGGDPKISQRIVRNEEDDSLSDAGTYTIETESQDKEVEEARNMIDQVQIHAADLEGPKWVSRWASLADSYAEPVGSYSYDTSESETSHSSRTRRLLPQVPPEKVESVTPSILIRVYVPPCSQDSTQRLTVQDDVDPDSLSDASRSEDGPALVNAKKIDVITGNVSPVAPGYQFKVQEKVSPTNKSTFFYIGAEDHPGKPEQARSPVQGERTRDPPAKTPPTTVLIRHLSGHEPRRTDSVPTKDSCIVRQESFTKDQPSDTVQMKKLPHISSHPSIRDMEQSIQETQPFLQETEGALSSLDTKVPSSGSGRSSKKEGSSTHMDDSLSGESDVDTASTVSQVSSKNAPVSSTSKKRPAISSFQKEKSSSSPSIQEKGRQLSARERLSEKRRTQTTDVPSKAEATKRFQMRRSTGNRGSLDLSEGQQGTAPNWTETTSSDHEISHPSSRTKKVIAPLQKEDNGKTPKSAAQQVLTRSNSLSAPRPTRASMLRRARLGDASDNEGTETDRTSQNSDHISAPPKVSAEGKKLSRLDILAMPRKRTGSFTTPSDNESSTSRSGFSGRNSEPAVTARKTSVGDARQAASKGGGAPLTPFADYFSGSRRKQKGSDFSSSSEEEYDTNTGFSKAKRSSHSTTAGQSQRSQRTAASRTKSVSLETEEDEDQNDIDPYQNWSTHSAEIAKLSQDLAKDLAILAKEIHDVAGDGDPPPTATSPSSLPNTPGSNISAREEVGIKHPSQHGHYHHTTKTLQFRCSTEALVRSCRKLFVCLQVDLQELHSASDSYNLSYVCSSAKTPCVAYLHGVRPAQVSNSDSSPTTDPNTHLHCVGLFCTLELLSCHLVLCVQSTKLESVCWMNIQFSLRLNTSNRGCLCQIY